MDILDNLDWGTIRQNYDRRMAVHKLLIGRLDKRDARNFAKLALGIDDPDGNYSAHEHSLGGKVLAFNGPDPWPMVLDLGAELREVARGTDVPTRVRAARISYLGISVGSEMACMLQPGVCWITNSRSVWYFLLEKHGGDYAKADEELKLYHTGQQGSEMDYDLWAALPPRLGPKLKNLASEGARESKASGVAPGPQIYLWADAIANQLYADHFGR